MRHTSKEQSPRATHRGRIISKQSNNKLEVPTWLSTELPSHIDAERGGEPGKNQTAKQSKKDAPNTKNMCHGPGKGRGCTQSTTPKHTLSIASLKVKNFKTNLNFVKELSNTHKILLLQEHWLYGFETAILEKIYDNCDYLVKCVDDADPILPVQPPRGYAGIGILWHKDLNHLITAIPDGSDRIAAVEIATPEDKTLSYCVYMYARGTSDGDIGFMQVLDELHEIVEKFRSTHRIIIGGDFNSSLHRSPPAKRDKLLKEFLQEQVYACLTAILGI